MKTTLLKNKGLNDDYEYLINTKLKNKKLDVYRSNNHEIILSDRLVLIHTINGNNHLKNYDIALNYVIDNIINTDDTRISALRYEVSTIDYIKNISDVNKYYKNININEKILEEYNIEKKSYADFMKKVDNVENYSSNHITRYFNESKPCYIIEEDFSTASYYNENIGRTYINMMTYLFNTGNNILTKDSVVNAIQVLKEKQFELMLNLFKEEYIQKLF
ncbi:MAG: hypothetical protein ACI4ON_07040 [Clostridia bacterium]